MKFLIFLFIGLFLATGCAQVYAEDGHDRSMKRHSQFRAEQKIIHGAKIEKEELKSDVASHGLINSDKKSRAD